MVFGFEVECTFNSFGKRDAASRGCECERGYLKRTLIANGNPKTLMLANGNLGAD